MSEPRVAILMGSDSDLKVMSEAAKVLERMEVPYEIEVTVRMDDESGAAGLAFEADGATPGASMMLRMWPGDLRIRLGRADFHGRWVHWDPVQLT